MLKNEELCFFFNAENEFDIFEPHNLFENLRQHIPYRIKSHQNLNQRAGQNEKRENWSGFKAIKKYMFMSVGLILV
jgi:hypothetical protein